MSLIDDALDSINRADFLPQEVKDHAHLDTALAIGYNQTNSQPTTVRLMLEWLDAKAGHKILDVGSGSGWTTALLAHIVGPKGFVYATEIVPELVEFGQKNTERAGVRNAKFFQTGKTYGLPDYAPYDRILVSASAGHLPEELPAQLKTGGKIVIPVKNDILEITRLADNNYKTITHPGFMFVPLI